MFLLCVICAIFFADVINANDVAVKTPQGTIHGHIKKSYKKRPYAAFDGIPYAKPPIGELRFKEPQPLEKKKFDNLVANETYICYHYSPIPFMEGPMGNEDCLYLYVYVPRTEIKETDKLLDVVIHIHGGAFVLGAPSFLAGPDYLMDQEVIYVSLNYRLGILGFLSTGDEVVPGNNGLKDQALALKWIKENIKYFGGNPDSITLTGLSAGGVSVHYHYLSPLSKGLFTRGYSLSGTVLQPWAVVNKPGEKAKRLAANLKCSTESSEVMVECLRGLPAKTLIDGILNFFVFINAIPFTPFGPVIEVKGPNAFIDEHPREMLKSGKFANDVPWINGNTRDEGIFPVGPIIMVKKLEEYNEKWDEISPYALNYYDTVEESKQKEISHKIREYYFKGEKLTSNNTDAFIKLFSDRTFFVGSREAMMLHSNAAKAPVYYYMFSYIPEQPGFFKDIKPGVSHSDDGKFIFKILSTPPTLSKNDEAMKDMMTKFLYTYANEGKAKVGDVEGKPLRETDMNYLYVESPKTVEAQLLQELDSGKFWDSLSI